MKKLAYFFFAIIFVAGCKPKELIPPQLEINPEDSIIECSNVKPAILHITATGQEDLISFNIETNPVVYRFDTTFPAFTHRFIDSFVIKIPEGIELPSDSIITTSITVADPYNSTTIVKYLRVVDAYPDLIQDTIILQTPKLGKSFFDLATHQLLDTTAEPGSFDLAFVVSNDGGYTITSPNAPWLASTLQDQGINYNAEQQRITKIARSLVDYDAMDDRYIYYMTVTERYLYNTPSYGIGVEGLITGTTIIFQAQDGRKGAIKVVGMHPADSAIILGIKYQWRPAK